MKRGTHEKDRRNKMVCLTPDGAELKGPLTKTVKQTIKHLTKGLDKKDMKGCRKVLKKLVQNLVEA
ncbi:MAG: hypothetical protein ACFB15_15445 [Cyclobacteriaceae bacterium]